MISLAARTAVSCEVNVVSRDGALCVTSCRYDLQATWKLNLKCNVRVGCCSLVSDLDNVCCLLTNKKRIFSIDHFDKEGWVAAPFGASVVRTTQAVCGRGSAHLVAVGAFLKTENCNVEALSFTSTEASCPYSCVTVDLCSRSSKQAVL